MSTKGYTPEMMARRRERQANTARQPKCRCGNCLKLGSTLCGRCEEAELEFRRKQTLNRLADRLLENGL